MRSDFSKIYKKRKTLGHYLVGNTVIMKYAESDTIDKKDLIRMSDYFKVNPLDSKKQYLHCIMDGNLYDIEDNKKIVAKFQKDNLPPYFICVMPNVTINYF